MWNLNKYIEELNDLPSDRNISWDNFKGRKTLLDSFLYKVEEDARLERLDNCHIFSFISTDGNVDITYL